MKTIILLFILTFSFSMVKSQSTHKIPYYNWSSPQSYVLSPSPAIKGYGEFSDSLANAYSVQEVYVHNGQYFLVNSWADYYLWYTTKYWFHFEMPELYHFHYYNNDNYQMTKYIATNFTGTYFPSRIAVTSENDLELFTQWSNKKMISSSDKKQTKYINRINKQAERNQSLTDTGTDRRSNMADRSTHGLKKANTNNSGRTTNTKFINNSNTTRRSTSLNRSTNSSTTRQSNSNVTPAKSSNKTTTVTRRTTTGSSGSRK